MDRTEVEKMTTHYKRLVATGCLAALLSSCAISPEPLGMDEQTDVAKQRLSDVVADQEPVTAPIDLYQAMARALKYNLDYKVEVMEQALRSEELTLTKVDMLPKLVANAHYTDRNNDSGGRSLSLLTGQESLEPSTSIERQHTTSDLTLSWDVLDFGLSYVRAKQRSDDVLIAMERRRKVANRIIEDVRTAYWRAISSEKLIQKLEGLSKSVEVALADSRKLESSGNTPPMDALTYQRELMSVRLQIRALHRDFAVAKKQLSTLMNLAPGVQYELVVPDNNIIPAALELDPNELMETALQYRPELRELDYKMRINSRETTAALLELLPGIRLYGGMNFDTNDLLYNDDWTPWGAQVSWNLMNVFRYPHHKAQVGAQEDLLNQQALATAMAIMTQVHISLTRYHLVNEELVANSEFLEIQRKIDSKISAAREAGRVGEQGWIRERMNTVVAELKHDIAYAALQNIYANIFASVGLDAFPEGIDGSESIADIGDALQILWESRAQ